MFDLGLSLGLPAVVVGFIVFWRFHFDLLFVVYRSVGCVLKMGWQIALYLCLRVLLGFV